MSSREASLERLLRVPGSLQALPGVSFLPARPCLFSIPQAEQLLCPLEHSVVSGGPLWTIQLPTQDLLIQPGESHT